MADKRIISLLTGIILVLCLSMPAVAADNANINTEHHYLGSSGFEEITYGPSVNVTLDEPALLSKFVKTSYDGYVYTFKRLVVIDAFTMEETEYERWQVNGGAKYTFKSNDDQVRVYYDTNRAVFSSEGGDSAKTYAVNYFKNIEDNEEPFYVQGRYQNGDKAIVTDKKPTRNGYRFVSWMANSAGFGSRYESNDEITIRGDCNLYAEWELLGGLETSVQDTANKTENPSTGAPASSPLISMSALLCIAAAMTLKAKKS